MDIRNERRVYEQAIRDVTLKAFADEPHGDHNEQEIIEALRRDDALTVSLVALVDEQVVGHVAISPVTTSDGAEAWYGLGPLSVAPEFQRRGIGAKLVEAALDELRKKNAAGCVVLGEPGYYGRFGFRQVPEVIFPGVPQEYFQTLILAGSLPAGEVKYHPAFY